VKEYNYLALKKNEFIKIIEKITSESLQLSIRKKNDTNIKILFQHAIPLAFFIFSLHEDEDSLKVRGKIIWTPLILVSSTILAFLELIIVGISIVTGKHNPLSYILVSGVWIALLGLFIYQTFDSIDNLLSNIYKVQV